MRLQYIASNFPRFIIILNGRVASHWYFFKTSDLVYFHFRNITRSISIKRMTKGKQKTNKTTLTRICTRKNRSDFILLGINRITQHWTCCIRGGKVNECNMFYLYSLQSALFAYSLIYLRLFTLRIAFIEYFSIWFQLIRSHRINLYVFMQSE